MLTYLLYGLFLLSCFVLIIAVLLQPGKADAGALFTSSVSSTAFGPRGTASILAKITIAAATTFMLTALLLGFGVGGPRSVVDSAGTAATPTPAATATPAAEGSPAASPQTGASPGASPAASTAASPAASPATGAGATASPAASPAAATSPAR